MWEVNRIVQCNSWDDLKKTAKRYEEMGFKCEVRGWRDISDNKLTLLDDWDVEKGNECMKVRDDMTRKERQSRLKAFITCLKCEVSGKCCDVNCPTPYEAGTMGEIIENLEAISKILEQEPMRN